MPTWARPVLVRLMILMVASVAILGGAWVLSQSGQPKAAQAPPRKQETAKKPEAAPTEPALIAPEPKKTTPAVAESGRPSKNDQPQNLLEVDLSKLPPDLASEVRGAIVDKVVPSQRSQGGDRRRRNDP